MQSHRLWLTTKISRRAKRAPRGEINIVDICFQGNTEIYHLMHLFKSSVLGAGGNAIVKGNLLKNKKNKTIKEVTKEEKVREVARKERLQKNKEEKEKKKEKKGKGKKEKEKEKKEKEKEKEKNEKEKEKNEKKKKRKEKNEKENEKKKEKKKEKKRKSSLHRAASSARPVFTIIPLMAALSCWGPLGIH
jgi:outer membrane biosynthesis protein TonB